MTPTPTGGGAVPLRRASVVDAVREALASRILDGDPAPGAFMTPAR